jgi:hypothetical protein
MAADDIEPRFRNAGVQSLERPHDRRPVLALPVESDEKKARAAPVPVAGRDLVIATDAHDVNPVRGDSIFRDQGVCHPGARHAAGV